MHHYSIEGQRTRSSSDASMSVFFKVVGLNKHWTLPNSTFFSLPFHAEDPTLLEQVVQSDIRRSKTRPLWAMRMG